jgi:hypothetical protein
VLIVATAGAPARAEARPGDPDDAEVAARLAWLSRVLDREAQATKLWWGGWVAFYGGAAVVEGALYATGKTAPERVDAAMNIGKAGIALGFTLLSPVNAWAAARAVRGSPAGTPAERLAKLRHAESRLESIAAEERDRRGWFALTGGALLNTAGAWIDWCANRGAGGIGWLGLASGLVVAQLQFHTQPTGAIRAWDAYRRAGAGARLGEPPAVLRWSIGPTAGGTSVRGEF